MLDKKTKKEVKTELKNKVKQLDKDFKEFYELHPDQEFTILLGSYIFHKLALLDMTVNLLGEAIEKIKDRVTK